MSESDQILAQGVPVPLADGTTAHVRFGMWGLKVIEDNYGSLAGMQVNLEQAFDTDEDGAPKGAAFSTILDILGIGLEHLELSPRDLANSLDGRYLNEYAEAISDALLQSLPEAEKTDPKAKKGTAKSPGRTSTTRQQSHLAVAKTSSGK